jgi:hypothetical protein
MGFADNGEFLATSLEGLLLQSDDMVLLVDKVEVFGRAPSEDPHMLDVARPVGKRSFIVVNEWHDEAHKVMIRVLNGSDPTGFELDPDLIR